MLYGVWCMMLKFFIIIGNLKLLSDEILLEFIWWCMMLVGRVVRSIFCWIDWVVWGILEFVVFEVYLIILIFVIIYEWFFKGGWDVCVFEWDCSGIFYVLFYISWWEVKYFFGKKISSGWLLWFYFWRNLFLSWFMF